MLSKIYIIMAQLLFYSTVGIQFPFNSLPNSENKIDFYSTEKPSLYFA